MKEYPSLREFGYEIFDYAGLFPPASLSLKEALINYQTYRHHDASWLMGNFLLPLSEWRSFCSLYSSGFLFKEPLSVTVLLPLVETLDDLIPLRIELERLQSALDNLPHVSIKALEWKWSSTLDIKDIVRSGNLKNVFTSVPWYIEWNYLNTSFDVETWTRCLSGLIIDTERSFGYKMRCGGLNASMVPTTRKVIRTIQACSRFQIPIKLTAGLHQPVRNYSNEIETWNYGFLNLAGAILWVNYFGLPDSVLEELLLESELSQFNFEADEIQWKNFALPATEIPDLKKRFFHGIGSCSFLEPVEALETRGLLNSSLQETR